jgi:hypothetical protein
MGASFLKVILAGPPHSGKSCLRDRLSRAISFNFPNLSYVITACPDGEGSWFAETHSRNPELAVSLKQQGKTVFTDKNADLYSAWVRNCDHPLTLIDIGGKISEQNRKICAGASHAVLVFADESKLAEWREFCKKLGLVIIAEIRSDLSSSSDVPLSSSEDGVFRGTIHNLVRGNLQSGPVETALANLLLFMCGPDAVSAMPDLEDDLFRMTLEGELLSIGFGRKPAQNTELVPHVSLMLEKLIADNNITHMPLIRVNGRTSVPIACQLARRLESFCDAIAVFDPKLPGYVIVKCSENGSYTLGQLLS